MSSKQSDDRLDPRLLVMIAVILLGGLLGILNSTMAAVATETLATTFDTSLSTVGWASTGFLLAVTATIPFTTWAVDRFGGRRLWLVGLALFLAGSLAAGLAWNVGSLIAFRTLQGVGAGLLDPLVLILLARAAGPQRAGRVMGLMGVVLSLGPALGPIAGGALLDGLSWRWMFLFSVPVGALAYLLALRVVPADAPTDTERPRLDVLGLALLAPGFTALVLALSQTAEHAAFTAWQAFLPLIVGVVLLIGYAVHALGSRRTPPLIDVRLFASRGFTASVTIMGLGGLANFATLFALPLYYQQAHGHGVLAAGLLMAPAGLGGAIAMPLAGGLSDRIGARGLAVGGALLAGLSALAFTRIGADTAEIWPVLAALAIGLGMGCFSAPTMGSLYRSLPGSMVAQGSSVLYMLNQLGAALGVALVTLILQTSGDPIAGFHGVFWLVAAAIAAVLAATRVLPGRPQTPAVHPQPVPSGKASS
ncbi:drug resistance transporter, EmrB/QacA subfamily [Thermomonospora echinospora]|uniref:Drug resistance transporter, EmrB/QacA subfamily n=1 Tax=Thermomonospora echinospora TaxID=1992 RepID=A0A1H6DXY5_9ACTN|nr:DHA2 family efflux MFS transporter permease subunit [Thermomonospora echinospora]SEG90158.1 drug resistance transporter, EmrB/QacA subfamily [Thermomonospora echinospora]